MQSTNTSKSGSNANPGSPQPTTQPPTSRATSLFRRFVGSGSLPAAASDREIDQSEVDRLTAERDEAMREIGRVLINRNQVQRDLDELRQSHAQTVAELENTRRSLRTAQEERDRARLDNAQITAAFDESRRELDSLRQTNAQILADRDAARREREEVQATNARISAELTACRDELERVTTASKSVMAQALADSAQSVELTRQLTQARSDTAELRTRLEHMEKTSTATINELRDQVSASTSGSAVERLTEQMRQMALERDDAVKRFHEIEAERNGLIDRVGRLTETDRATDGLLTELNKINEVLSRRVSVLNAQVLDLLSNKEKADTLEVSYAQLHQSYIQLQVDFAKVSQNNVDLYGNQASLQRENARLVEELKNLRQTFSPRW